MTGYIVRGIDPAAFVDLYGLDEEGLFARGARRVAVEKPNEAPCRITLADADPGETVLLVNYEHQSAQSPYRSSHAIYVREGARDAAEFKDELPESLATRLLSIRAFDHDDMIVDAEVIEGADAESWIIERLSQPDIAYLHAHNARRGCFAARIHKAD